MIDARPLLLRLTEPGITEVVVNSGQPATAHKGPRGEMIEAAPLSTDAILQLLFNAGGSRHVDSLGPTPSHWVARIEGIGPIDVSATMTGDRVQARFTLRYPKGLGSPAPRAAAPAPPPQSTLGPDDKTSPAIPATPRPGAVRLPTFEERPAARPPSSRTPPSEDRPAPRPASSRAPAEPRRSPGSPGSAGAPGRSTTQPSPTAARLGSDEVSFDFEVDNEVERAVARGVPPPPPPRAVLDTPFAGLEVGDEWTAEIERPPSRPDPLELRPPSRPAPLDARPPSAPAPVPAPIPPATPGPAAPVFPSTPAVTATRSTPAWDPARAAALAGPFRELLQAARGMGASDLHLVATRRPLFRIAGELQPRGEPLDPGVVASLILPRVPVRLLPALENEGSCDFALEEPGAGRFRVNVGRQRTGLKASFRLIPREIPTLASLGLPEVIGLATRHHQGLIVLTGPTGHGKTTTLAAVVDILNRETARHVITVEDPVEFIHPRKQAMMSQREVGTHTRSFASALKASLREDPDVIVVGELRDTETVRMALSASETGHLVLGTMNTPSAAKTIDRLIDLFPPADQQQVRVTLAGGLRLIVSQRLLPSADRASMVAAAEVLPGSLALWNLIRDGRTYQIPSLQQRGKSLGIVRLDDSLAALVRANRTTLDAALAIAESPAELEAILSGKQRSTTAQPPLDIDDPPSGEAKPKGFLGSLLGKRGS